LFLLSLFSFQKDWVYNSTLGNKSNKQRHGNTLCQNFQLRRQSARLQDLARSLCQIHRKLDSRSRSEVFSVWIGSPMFPIDPKMPFQEYKILGMGSKKTWVGLKDVSKHIHLPLTCLLSPVFSTIQKGWWSPIISAKCTWGLWHLLDFLLSRGVNAMEFFYTKHVAGVMSWWYE